MKAGAVAAVASTDACHLAQCSSDASELKDRLSCVSLPEVMSTTLAVGVSIRSDQAQGVSPRRQVPVVEGRLPQRL